MTRELDIGSSVLLTDFGMCINYYRLFSPGLYCCTLVPVQLDEQTRLCPGMMVMVNYGRHKQCTADYEAECFRGAPNFVLDTFPKGGLPDYENRRTCYERAGVIEYVALQDGESLRCLWNRRVDGKFVLIESDDPGVIRSAALPGLWIPTEALQQRDWWAIMASIARGVTRLPHHEMMESIWRKS
jgi:hypothetical protein